MTVDHISNDEQPISIAPEQRKRLEEVASKTGQSVNDIVDAALNAHLERLQVLARMDKGDLDLAEGRVVPHAKVSTWLASWGTEEEQDAPTWR